ncbi:MAG: putative toxin-antitoxin system toxin component, PIN family [Gammaproteobacteria bacterium]
MRLVLDTNVLVSAFLWEGLPGRLIALADEQVITLYTSRVLLDELSVVLQRGKFTRRVQATGLSAAQLVRHYQRLAHRISVRQLTQRISRDADDDQVLACARAAKADLIVSGDRDLLDLNTPGRAHRYGGAGVADHRR